MSVTPIDLEIPRAQARAHAHVIPDGDEALEVARGLSDEFAAGAAERDAERRLPVAELQRLSASGLLGITVPREHGGAGVGAVTWTEVFRLLAAGDPNLAQIPQSHFVYINVLKQQGTPAQQAFFFAEVLAGKRLGNAQSEAGTKHLQDIRTRLSPAAGGGYLLSGVKQLQHRRAVRRLDPGARARGGRRALRRLRARGRAPVWRWSTTGTAWVSARPRAARCAWRRYRSRATGLCPTTSRSAGRNCTGRGTAAARGDRCRNRRRGACRGGRVRA